MATAKLTLEVTESSVNIANNTSLVTAKLYYYGNGTSWSHYKKSGTITIDGTAYSFSSTFETSTSKQLLATKSKTVTHGADGSKKVSVSGKFVTELYPGTLTVSTTKTLTTIPRVSDLSLNKTSVPADETTTVIATATKKHSSLTDTIVVKLGSYSKTVTSGTAFTIPKSWCAAMPSGTSATATVTVTTKSGSTTIGSKSVNLTVTVPASVVPSISSLTATEAVNAVTAAFGSRFVQSLSQANINVAAAGIYGSTIKSYKVVFDGVTYVAASFKSNAINGSGALKLTATVTDSRGRTATASITVNVIAYAPPSITSMSYVTCNADGTPNSAGTCTKVTIAGKVSPVDNQNSRTLKLKYKAMNVEAYTERAITISAYTFEVSSIITGTKADITYEFVAVLTDKMGSTTSQITTGVPCISRRAGGKGVTLFREATDDGFWVGNIDYTMTDTEFNELIKLVGGGGK